MNSEQLLRMGVCASKCETEINETVAKLIDLSYYLKVLSENPENLSDLEKDLLKVIEKQMSEPLKSLSAWIDRTNNGFGQINGKEVSE